MKIIRGIDQGTLEWQQLRRGKITGTKLADVMGSPLDRLNLIAELIAEEGTEQTKAMRPTPEMERGQAEEVFARQAFADKYKKKVETATMLVSDQYPWLAVSPDGIIPDRKGKFAQYTEQIELKNPNSATMIKYKMANLVSGCPLSKKHFLGIPCDYQWQIVASFLVNDELKKMYFVVYDARFIDDEHKMYVVTVDRDNEDLQKAMIQAGVALESFREEWLATKEIVLPITF